MFDDTWQRNQSFDAWGTIQTTGRRRRARGRIPVRQVLLFALAVFSFKIFLFHDLGGSAYGAKMIALSEGNSLERIAASAMAMDPVSEWIVNGIRFGSW